MSLSSSSPSARTDASSAYDPATRTIVLFGGADRSGVLGETWTWDAAGWHLHHPATSPPAREFAWMAFDAATSRMVLFGGLTCAPPSGNVPTGCDYQQAPTPLHDTWSWDGSTWSQLHTAHAPATTDFRGDVGGMAPDPGHHDLVLVTWPFVGRSSIETWTLTDGDWIQLHPAHPPRSLEFSGPAYDLVSRRVVLQQQGDRSADVTYWWDGSDWQSFELSVRTPHGYGTLTSVGSHGLLLIFGGNVNAWNGRSWSDVRTLPTVVSVSPQSRSGWTASYFEPSGELILFGGRVGFGGPVLLGDTVGWDGQSWKTLVAAPASPLGPLAKCSEREAISGYGDQGLDDSTGMAMDVEFYLPASGPCHLSTTVTLTLLLGTSPLPIGNNPASQRVEADLTAQAGGVVVTFTARGICAFGQNLIARRQAGDFDNVDPVVLGSQCPVGSTTAVPAIVSSVRRTPGRP